MLELIKDGGIIIMQNTATENLTAKETLELEKLKKKQAQPTGKNYLFIMIFLVAIIYIVDEITSNIRTNMNPMIIDQFFVQQGKDYNEGLAQLTYLTSPGTFLMFILPFYKALADKFGRKPFLILNTIGMGVSMLITMTAPNIVMVAVGSIVTTFFIPNDMQVMYIMEVAPEKHRAKIASITKAIGYLGVTSVPILMRTVMNNDSALWRNVYIIPIALAFGVSLVSFFFFKETPVFLNKRIGQLETKKLGNADAAEDAKPVKKEKTGVLQAVKFIVLHKQVRNIVIACMLFAFSLGGAIQHANIMATNGMTTEQLTQALLFFPVTNAIMTFSSGFLTDIAGRKKSAITMGILTVGVLVVFIYGTTAGFPPALLGILMGVGTGLLWSVSDLIFIILPSESTPTHIRASVLGTLSLVFNVGGMISGIIFATLISFISSLATVCLIMAPALIFACLLVIALGVKETKGVNMETVTGE